MIRDIQPADSSEFVALRQQALKEGPLAFHSSPETDRFRSSDRVRRWLDSNEESWILGAFRPTLVGTIGALRDSRPKAAHRIRLWGVYVAPQARRTGIGSKLMAATLERCRSLPGIDQVGLSVSEQQPAALSLYRAHGFEVWGRDPGALRHAGRTVDLLHLVLDLTD